MGERSPGLRFPAPEKPRSSLYTLQRGCEDGGAGSWSEALVDGPDCGGTGGCYPEQIYADDSMGTRIVDSVPVGPGDRLGQLALAGDQLTWTHDGAPRQSTLG